MSLKLASMFNARLTTAEILYFMPDFPDLLQTFLWQQTDQAPDFPRLWSFLDYWDNNIEGKIHTVTVAHAGLTNPAEFRFADTELKLH